MNKLEILVNDTALDLGDAVFLMERHLRVLLFEEEPGSKVFNVNIPATKNNDTVLNFGRKLLNTLPTNEYNALVRFNGVEIFTGVLLVKQATRLAYEVTIGFNNGEFYYRSKDTLLEDCTYEDITYNNTSKATATPRNTNITPTVATTETVLDLVDNSDPLNLITNLTGNNSFITINATGFYLLSCNLSFTRGTIALLPSSTFTIFVRNVTTAELISETAVSAIPTTINIFAAIRMFWATAGDVIQISMKLRGSGGPALLTFSGSSIELNKADSLDGLLAENTGNYPLNKFAVFPVRNEVFGAGSSLLSEVRFQNPMQVDTVGNAYHFLRSAPYPITPFFYLNYVLDKAIASIGWELEYNWLTLQAEWKDLVIYNNYDVGSHINYLIAGVPALIVNAQNHVPVLTVWELVSKVCQALNLLPIYNDSLKTIKLIDGELLGTVTRIEDWEDASGDYILYLDQDNGNCKIVQQITQDNFTTETLYGRALNASWKINDAVANFAALPSTDKIGSVRQELANNEWYIKVGDVSWEIMSTVIPVHINGTGANEIAQDWMSVYMTGYQPIVVDAGTEDLYCPQLEVVGRSAYHTNVPEKLTNLRLLFYRGLQECVMNTTVTVPLGSSTPARKEQPGAVTLQSGMACALWYEAEHFLAGSGIVAQRYAKTLAWLTAGKPVELYKQLTAAQIKNLNQTTKYRVGGGLLTVQSIEADLKKEEIGPSIIKGFLN